MPKFEKLENPKPEKGFAEKLQKADLSREELKVISQAASNSNNLERKKDGKHEMNKEMQKAITDHLKMKGMAEFTGESPLTAKDLKQGLLNRGVQTSTLKRTGAIKGNPSTSKGVKM